MGLNSSMSTALTGMNAAQTDIDVVGNNLANADTVGFKESDTDFVTQFLQTLSTGTAPSADNGGTNPVQTGLGTTVAQITPDFSQGTIQVSSNPTNMAIQGNGFFIAQGAGGQQLYTRDGEFKLNAANELTTAAGNGVLGYGVNSQFQLQTTTLVPLTIPLGTATAAQATSNVTLQGTLSPTGDLATTAAQIETGILGDGSYSQPAGTPTLTNGSSAAAPDISQTSTPFADASATPGQGLAAGTYQYEIVYGPPATGTDPTQPINLIGSSTTPVNLPSAASLFNQSAASALPVVDTTTSGFAATTVNLTGIASPPVGEVARIYRTTNLTGATSASNTFYYVGETTGTTFSDNITDAQLTDTQNGTPQNATLSQTMGPGTYSYYVTYYNTVTGQESRPTALSAPITVGTAGQVDLTNLPFPSSTETDWPPDQCCYRIYRNVMTTGDTGYYRIGQTQDLSTYEDANGNFTNPTFVDSVSDHVASQGQVIDLDGPKIQSTTKLSDVISRSGSDYENVFNFAGSATLEFTGQLGSTTLATRNFTINANTTVGDLENFLTGALGIQQSTSGNSIPPSQTASGATVEPGATINNQGQIVITGNNGVDNAVNIGLSGMNLVTTTNGTTSTTEVNLPWTTTQQAVGQTAVTNFTAYNSLGVPVQVQLTAALESQTGGQTTYQWFADSSDNQPADNSGIAVGTGQITFDSNGNYVSATSNQVTIHQNNDSSPALIFNLDFSQLSGLAATTSSLSVSQQDGFAPGVLSSFNVGSDGLITGVFSNGVSRDLGQFQIAGFANPDGLEQEGQNMYAAGVNSGLPTVANPGQSGNGTIVAGATELSNADVGANLIQLILDSTMYSANSKVISTVQQLFQELLNIGNSPL